MSNKDDWETPDYLFLKLNAEFNFTLDVCANGHNAKCEKYFSKQQDGLIQDWTKEIFWMNPPYGREISKWIKKAHESGSYTTGVCLIPVRSDTRWWHEHVMYAKEIRLLTKRLSFQGSNNKAPFPNALVIFSPGYHVSPVLSSYVV